MTESLEAGWRRRLADLPPGNYLLTKFEEGYRVWGTAADQFADTFARLNAEVDANKAAVLAESDDD